MGDIFLILIIFRDFYLNLCINFWFLILIFLSIFRKSSLLGFNFWLPMAMERPTPVSSLLHSSTIVVARVFLSVKYSLFYTSKFLLLLRFLRIFTSYFSRFLAFGWFDLKKIVAFSTTSQLGLIILIVRFLNFRLLIFHILYHAFSKAIIFISTGIPIHILNNFQDFRKVTFRYFSQIISFNFCLIFGSLSLIGIYFYVCFYSKDKFLFNIFNFNFSFLLIFVFILSCFCTFRYSKSLIKFSIFVPFNYFSKLIIFNGKIFIKLIFMFLILIFINRFCLNFNFRFLNIFESFSMIFGVLPLFFIFNFYVFLNIFKNFSFLLLNLFNISIFHIKIFKFLK